MELAFTDENKPRKNAPSKNWTEQEIATELQRLDAKIEEATTSAGAVEVRDAILDKAELRKVEARDYP